MLQSNPKAHMSWLLGFLLIFFSFVFWKLDSRNKDLIKGAEAALEYFEQNSNLKDEGEEPHVAKIFARERFLTSRKRRQNSILFWKNDFSFTKCFGIIFTSFGLLGLAGIVVSLV
jgi:hypothetical protein